MKEFEIIEVTENEIACNGGNGSLGHPKIYLYIPKETGSITCPYCSKKYILKKN